MNKKILVVDDDQYIRELYEEVLKNAGYEVDTAVDGEQGLELLKKGGYGVIFLDMMMPKIDGLGVLNELNENPPEIPNGPIVLLSNLDNESAIDEAVRRGVVDNLIKADITPDQLLAKVEKHLGKNVQ